MKPYRTVKDAIGDLVELEAGESAPNDPMHEAPNHQDSTVEKIKRTPSGESPPNYAYESDRRLYADRPAYTVLAKSSTYRNTHPSEPRGLTLRERAILQSFPDDWVFSGGKGSSRQQIGNAVPPLVAKRLAEVIV